MTRIRPIYCYRAEELDWTLCAVMLLVAFAPFAPRRAMNALLASAPPLSRR